MTYNFQVNDSFENLRDLFAIYNYLNTFFTRYIFHIIIFFFRYNNDLIFLFEKANYKLIKSFTIIF